MKKRILILFATLLYISTMTACGCEHYWKAATCTEAKTCTECGETQGKALGHDWEDATCTQPQICSRCNERQGKALGHNWKDATCTEPRICTVCQKTAGKTLDHTAGEWTITKEATCTEEGTRVSTCVVCQASITDVVSKKEHTTEGWDVTKPATLTESGEVSRICTICGTIAETETYELSAEEKKSAYKTECKNYTYNEIARNPEKYKSQYAKFTGEVIQVIEDGNDYNLRVNITHNQYYWDDTIYVTYTKQDSSEPRILEDDIITMYGTLGGTYTYETVLGSSLTIPLLYAMYIDLN